MNVFILAAGLGTRLRPLTLKYPKPCVPFLNVPLGLYPFRFLNSLNVTQLTVNTHYLPEQVQNLYTTQPYYTGPVKFSHEEGIILGSAGGLKKASQYFDYSDDENILMLNSDEIFFDVESDFLAKAYNQHVSAKSLATLVVMKHPEAGKKFGAIWCEGNTVKNIGKTASGSKLQPYHYIGLIFLNKRVLSLIPDDKETNIFYDVLNFHLATGAVCTYEINCNWFETGNPADYLQATAAVLKNISAETLGFINAYDCSDFSKDLSRVFLISKSLKIDGLFNPGFTVVSKSTNPELLKNLGLFHNSILFDNENVNVDYFKA